jgi:predicted nicotinamide N-methyase
MYKETMRVKQNQFPTVQSTVSNVPPSDTNRPRNFLVTDATQPFTLSFKGRFEINTSIAVNQTPAGDLWPGGALWDLGVLLSQVFVACAAGGSATVTLTTMADSGKSKNTSRLITLPDRLSDTLGIQFNTMQDSAVILELGCGVGLTGLVAAAALGAKTTVLTDLQLVIDGVTKSNLESNTIGGTNGRRTINKGKSNVMALPLCWGNAEHEQAVAALLHNLDTSLPSIRTRRKKKGTATALPVAIQAPSRTPGIPDIIIIGDVAYQQKPGAPSHFEALMSTLLKFVDDQTIVVFGTRIRMQASVDLLDLFLEHFVELVTPPLAADEIDSSFTGVKHNMSIHFLQKKRCQ